MANSNEPRSLTTARIELIATILLIIVTLLVGGVTIWDRLSAPKTQVARDGPTSPPTLTPPADPVSIQGAPVRGDRNAAVALIVFSDFECPYCAKSALNVLPELERQYVRRGKLALVWRHLPLAIHKNARRAAEAAECAGGQGKFWEFHDWAFQHQSQLDEPNLHAAAKTLGLDLTAYGVCLAGQATAKVDADLDAAKRLAVSGTPTWFIGVIQTDGQVRVTERLEGSRALTVFQKAIDNSIAAADDYRSLAAIK